ncbi:MAG: prepilin-type N-terminal cleavage/methylation domain-containing protein [Firmicutes bacterium]|jgi:prepilin-type N-terminal cleavage/methylation domain-containing protein|nr:prepilin-type N-terminal cleavage/methylation domain-containing protein [Bacillota bacterium]
MTGYKKKMWQRIVDERALTMVELLIAMALTGLIAAGAYSLYFMGIVSWERGVEARENLQSVRMALREIEQDLRHAEWVWIGEGWEEAWHLEDCLQPGSGDQVHYGFYGDLYAGEYRPHFTFYTVRLWNDTLYLHKNAVLTELRDIYPIYKAPLPLADNIMEISFRYGDERENRILISITAARGGGRTVTLTGNILRRNMLH